MAIPRACAKQNRLAQGSSATGSKEDAPLPPPKYSKPLAQALGVQCRHQAPHLFDPPPALDVRQRYHVSFADDLPAAETGGPRLATVREEVPPHLGTYAQRVHVSGDRRAVDCEERWACPRGLEALYDGAGSFLKA
eukprot:scaffold8269_cov286-Pinguiococcus_pyrenoidosus.AAC.4